MVNMMDEPRINAVMAEFQWHIQILTQRCLSLAGELAGANAKIAELTAAKETKKQE